MNTLTKNSPPRKRESHSQLQFSFVPASPRKLYATSKRHYTEARIIGAIRCILKASGGAYCFPSARRIQSITGLSESTVRRYLHSALDLMAEAKTIRLEIDKAKGYRICTPEWLENTRQHGDLFMPSRFLRSPWLTQKQRAKAFTPPLSKSASAYKRSGKPKNKQRAFAPVMLNLARRILKRTPIPNLPRASPTEKQSVILAARLLSEGHCRTVVGSIVRRAWEITDTAVSDGLTVFPERYVWGVLRQMALAHPPLSKSAIAARCRIFWTDQRAAYQGLYASAPSVFGAEAHLQTLAYFEAKLA